MRRTLLTMGIGTALVAALAAVVLTDPYGCEGFFLFLALLMFGFVPLLIAGVVAFVVWRGRALGPRLLFSVATMAVLAISTLVGFTAGVAIDERITPEPAARYSGGDC